MEYRTLTASGLQTRKEGDNAPIISGYFVVFDSPYEMFNGQAYETVDPHALDDTLNEDIRCLIDHDTRLVLGRNTAHTLKLSIDSHGLYGECEINVNDTDAVNLYERVKRGDVSQCSFGFEVVEEETEYLENGVIHWTLKKVRLHEVSVVTFPAYKATEVNARADDLKALKEKHAEAWREEMRRRINKGER